MHFATELSTLSVTVTWARGAHREKGVPGLGDARLGRISEILREEEDRFLGYEAISQRSAELGFATSVRTLRFYANEGILPPPRKRGKTPVFPEPQIFKLLLSIHLMKTRFQRSLAEIKAILQHQRENPEVLADKLSSLYEECDRSERLQRAEREWLVDAFFRSLTGKLTLYPRRVCGISGPRQAGELLLTEMLEDLAQLGRWVTPPRGEPTWCSPEEVLRETVKDGATGVKGVPMTSGASTPEPGTGPRVTPVQPPQGSVTVEVARRREELFLQRFERNLLRVQRIYQPREKRYYSMQAESLDPVIDDPYQQVVDVLKAHNLYDRRLLESLPHDRSTRYTLPTPGLFRRKKPRLVVAGIVRSPVADLARLGGAVEPLGREELLEVVRTEVRDATAYHILGVLSTVGWSEEAKERMPRGDSFALVLVEQAQNGGWLLTDTLSAKHRELLTVFDPEDFTEKVSRTFYAVIDEPELKIPGGHIEVGRLIETLGVDREILDAALKQVEQENPRIQVTEVGGRQILKRARY